MSSARGDLLRNADKDLLISIVKQGLETSDWIKRKGNYSPCQLTLQVSISRAELTRVLICSSSTEMEGRQETSGSKLEMFSVFTSCYRPANDSQNSVSQ